MLDNLCCSRILSENSRCNERSTLKHEQSRREDRE